MTNPTTPQTHLPNTPASKALANHQAAMRAPRPGFESAIVSMYKGWVQYAEITFKTYESRIGDDYVLGPEWAAIGRAIRGLLNGQCGRIDAGTLDAMICDHLRGQGFEV